MKAFVLVEHGRAEFADKPYPTCDEYGAIVKATTLAPCTSDVSNTYKLTNPLSVGRTLGHEAIGEVVEVGSKVRDFAPGDRVLVPSITPDYMFTYEHQQLPDGVHSGGDLNGYRFTSQTEGTFAEYFSVIEADQNLAKIPDGVSDEQAVMIVDMMNTGFFGAELADIKFGDTVLVYGIGPVGLMAVAGARLRGAGRIIAVGNRPVTQEVAKRYGATDLVDYKQGPVPKQVRSLTGGRGVDRAIVAGGTLDAVGECMRMVRPHGRVANIVYFAQLGGTLEIPLSSWGFGMSNKELVSGCCPGGRARMERLALMVQNGMVDPSHLVTHRFEGIDAVEEAFELMHNHPKDLIKPVVKL